MKSLFDYLGRRSVILPALVAAVGLGVALALADARFAGLAGEGILAYQGAFTKARTLQILSQWGEAGVALYLKTVWLDYLFPIAFAVFFGGLIALLLRNKRGKPSVIHLALFSLPFLAAFFDYVENTLQIYLVFDTATKPDSLFFLMSTLAVVKKAFLAATLLIIGYFSVVRGYFSVVRPQENR